MQDINLTPSTDKAHTLLALRLQRARRARGVKPLPDPEPPITATVNDDAVTAADRSLYEEHS